MTYQSSCTDALSMYAEIETLPLSSSAPPHPETSGL